MFNRIPPTLCSLFLLFLFSALETTDSSPTGEVECKTRKFDHDKIVCVCSEERCDNGIIINSYPNDYGEVATYTSNKAGDRFKFRNQTSEGPAGVGRGLHGFVIDLDKQEEFIGWGGAFTDAFGENVKSLPEKLQEALLSSYFDDVQGLGYNLCRVPIGGTDFSSRNYSYDDSEEPDLELKKWALAREDHEYKIPLIKRAKEMRGESLKLFASSWSAPAWMKDNESLVRGHLKRDDKVYEAYSNYLAKFFEAYAEEGIYFWGATVQNEPVAAYLPFYYFNSMQFSADEMIKFVGRFLGPALAKVGIRKDNFKLMVGDDSLGFVNHQVPRVLEDDLVRHYVSGLAFHWYTSGSLVPYRKLTELYRAVKPHIQFMIMSEACEGSMPMQRKVDPGSWERAESYASDIIEDLNRGTTGWVDWNMALNMNGGPNWSGNFVDSPILVNASAGEFYWQPMYYALAHFTKFFQPCRSVKVECERKFYSKSLLAASFYDPKYKTVFVNVLNKSNSPLSINLKMVSRKEDRNFIVERVELDERSLTSILIRI